jgi:hypothetical protein
MLRQQEAVVRGSTLQTAPSAARHLACPLNRRAYALRLRVARPLGVPFGEAPVATPLATPARDIERRLRASPTVGTFSSFISTNALVALRRPLGTGFLYVAK